MLRECQFLNYTTVILNIITLHVMFYIFIENRVMSDITVRMRCWIEYITSNHERPSMRPTPDLNYSYIRAQITNKHKYHYTGA